MAALLLALAALTAPPDAALSPDEAHAIALADLRTLPPERRRVTRYLDLSNAPANDRESLARALVFAANSTSFRTNLATLPAIADGRLLRVDLEALGWDAGSRRARFDRLKLAKVDLAVKDADLAKFLDVWELIASADPYHQATVEHQGKVVRGWIDPVADLAARQASYSSRFLLRGDWLLSKLMVESQLGGHYSALLMLPPKEADLYRAFGIDAEMVERENQLKRGGAVLESIVALHNRELQQIPSLYGLDDRFIWRTFDVSKDADGDKSILEAFAGRLKLDGREIIGSLPNGLHWYYLANAAGAQVAEVPPDIAQDKREGRETIRDRRVLNAYKCVACHGPQSGTYPFDDVVGKAMRAPDVGLLAIFRDKDKLADEKQRVEEYYLSDLGRTIRRQQESYAERVKAANGDEPGPNSVNVVGRIEAYTYDLVTPAMAAREMGMSPADARKAWLVAGNPQLAVLASGQPIRRAAWEKSFGDAMRALVHPWETRK